MKKQESKTALPPVGIVIHIYPKDGGWVGTAHKDGRLLSEVVHPTLYYSVIGQLRQVLDTGATL